MALKIFAKTTASPAEAPSPEQRSPSRRTSPSSTRAWEVGLALAALADIGRTGQLSAEVVALLKDAAQAFVADNLKLRPAPDVEAERVDVTAPPEAAQPLPATESGASIIPIRG